MSRIKILFVATAVVEPIGRDRARLSRRRGAARQALQRHAGGYAAYRQDYPGKTGGLSVLLRLCLHVETGTPEVAFYLLVLTS